MSAVDGLAGLADARTIKNAVTNIFKIIFDLKIRLGGKKHTSEGMGL